MTRLINENTSANQPGPRGSYGYDEMNRLESVDYGEINSQASWSYDVADNRSQASSAAYDALNRLANYGGQTVGYDAPLGGSIALNDGSGRVNVWDDQNRLMETTRQGVTHSFLYGPDGLRRTATTGGVTTQYILDGQNVVQEMSPSGVVSYLWGPRGPEARIAPDESALWYLYDKHGNVLGEVDANGVTNPDSQGLPTPLRKFDVWGGVRNAVQVADNGNKLKYCGALGHPTEDTGLIYMRARYYDPDLGRFISEDPAKDGGNWYAYAGNDPVGMVDEDGCRFRVWEGAGYWLDVDKASTASEAHFVYGVSRRGQELEWGALKLNGKLHDAGRFIPVQDSFSLKG